MITKKYFDQETDLSFLVTVSSNLSDQFECLETAISPNTTCPTFIMAHGAGAGMDSEFMNQMAEAIAAHNIRVVRFEFPYMHLRRIDGKKRPPNREKICLATFADVLACWRGSDVFIGGKSMGGRMASLLAACINGSEHTAAQLNNLETATESAKSISVPAGVFCLGYPFHAPGKPDKCRTDHFPDINCPLHILQGERDAFGNRAEIEEKQNKDSIWQVAEAGLIESRDQQKYILWLPDGDHSFKPRVKSGVTLEDNIREAAKYISATINRHS
ncbi:MAG: alpha/beta family hydrolase [Alphaproteobacteria bacterium]|nr:alpha/beta family hydrolase [Alphaproteobacteria bacterium]